MTAYRTHSSDARNANRTNGFRNMEMAKVMLLIMSQHSKENYAA